jgi:hypothetical protein
MDKRLIPPLARRAKGKESSGWSSNILSYQRSVSYVCGFGIYTRLWHCVENSALSTKVSILPLRSAPAPPGPWPRCGHSAGRGQRRGAVWPPALSGCPSLCRTCPTPSGRRRIGRRCSLQTKVEIIKETVGDYLWLFSWLSLLISLLLFGRWYTHENDLANCFDFVEIFTTSFLRRILASGKAHLALLSTPIILSDGESNSLLL